MGGTTGNKGSIAVRLMIYATSLCFICSHFAAGQNEVRDRNEDYVNTVKKIRFPMVLRLFGKRILNILFLASSMLERITVDVSKN